MKYAEVAELKHDPGCTWRKGDDFCDCGAIEKSLAARVAELEAQMERAAIACSQGESITARDILLTALNNR